MFRKIGKDKKHNPQWFNKGGIIGLATPGP